MKERCGERKYRAIAGFFQVRTLLVFLFFGKEKASGEAFRLVPTVTGRNFNRA
jgi:hypothetical protein